MADDPTIRKRYTGTDQPDPMEVSDENTWGILDELRGIAAELQNTGWKSQRPWGEFFEKFKSPKAWSREALDERITTNVLHFRGNYLFVCAAILIIFIVTSPALLGVAVLSTLILLFFFGNEPTPVVISGREFTEAERRLIASVSVLLLLSATGAIYRLLYATGVSALLCLLHAIFRPRNLKSKANRVQEEVRMNTGVTLENVAAGFMNMLNGNNKVD